MLSRVAFLAQQAAPFTKRTANPLARQALRQASNTAIEYAWRSQPDVMKTRQAQTWKAFDEPVTPAPSSELITKENKAVMQTFMFNTLLAEAAAQAVGQKPTKTNYGLGISDTAPNNWWIQYALVHSGRAFDARLHYRVPPLAFLHEIAERNGLNLNERVSQFMNPYFGHLTGLPHRIWDCSYDDNFIANCNSTLVAQIDGIPRALVDRTPGKLFYVGFGDAAPGTAYVETHSSFLESTHLERTIQHYDLNGRRLTVDCDSKPAIMKLAGRMHNCEVVDTSDEPYTLDLHKDASEYVVEQAKRGRNMIYITKRAMTSSHAWEPFQSGKSDKERQAIHESFLVAKAIRQYRSRGGGNPAGFFKLAEKAAKKVFKKFEPLQGTVRFSRKEMGERQQPSANRAPATLLRPVQSGKALAGRVHVKKVNEKHTAAGGVTISQDLGPNGPGYGVYATQAQGATHSFPEDSLNENLDGASIQTAVNETVMASLAGAISESFPEGLPPMVDSPHGNYTAGWTKMVTMDQACARQIGNLAKGTITTFTGPDFNTHAGGLYHFSNADIFKGAGCEVYTPIDLGMFDSLMQHCYRQAKQGIQVFISIPASSLILKSPYTKLEGEITTNSMVPYYSGKDNADVIVTADHGLHIARQLQEDTSVDVLGLLSTSANPREVAKTIHMYFSDRKQVLFLNYVDGGILSDVSSEYLNLCRRECLPFNGNYHSIKDDTFAATKIGHTTEDKAGVLAALSAFNSFSSA